MIHVSLALPAWAAIATPGESIRVLSERSLAFPAPAASTPPVTPVAPAASTAPTSPATPATQAAAKPASPLLYVELTAVVIADAGWQIAEAQQAITEALPILVQCGVALQSLKLIEVAAPAAYRDLAPQTARLLTSRLAPARPAIFFVRTTRMRPAFEAEAFGAGNTRTRPELINTVWVTRSAPDLPETLAHELFHVIANSGEHSDDEANLMHDSTAPGRRQLTPAQCVVLRENGRVNRLLRD